LVYYTKNYNLKYIIFTKLLDKLVYLYYNIYVSKTTILIKRKGVWDMREIKADVCEFDGYAVTVDIEGNVDEYAKSFLHIFNNVRESKELINIRNYYDSNEVTVYCESDSKDDLIKYLKAFGEVKACERVLCYQMAEPEYDLDKYYDVVIATRLD
jgi:hypothetical protein